jgi:transposase
VTPETSTLSGWVGATAAALAPLVDALAAEVMRSGTLHVDDTLIPVLAPGAGKTKTGRLWVYVRDERPFAGSRPPAALFFSSSDRKGEHQQEHLKGFRSVIHADGYAGFNELFAGNLDRRGRLLGACPAQILRRPRRHRFADREGSARTHRRSLRGREDDHRWLPDHRRGERQQRSKPIAEALRAWAEATLPKLSRKSELAKAFRYMRSRWKALLRYLDDGRLALDNNPAERALRCVAIGRKNYLFAGLDAGGRRAAAIYSLIETAKLNGLNPQYYLADVLARIADHPARQSGRTPRPISLRSGAKTRLGWGKRAAPAMSRGNAATPRAGGAMSATIRPGSSARCARRATPARRWC